MAQGLGKGWTKFKPIGPVIVYIHKDTAKLATYVDQQRRDWPDMESIEAWVAENFSGAWVNVFDIPFHHSEINVHERRVVYDRKKRVWRDDDQGLEFGTHALVADTPETRAQLEAFQAEEKRLAQERLRFRERWAQWARTGAPRPAEPGTGGAA